MVSGRGQEIQALLEKHWAFELEHQIERSLAAKNEKLSAETLIVPRHTSDSTGTKFPPQAPTQMHSCSHKLAAT